MKETTLTGESKDILNENIETLKELFPEIVSEDKIDFDKFKTIFGGEIDDSSERYSFTWPGKTQAIKESQKQSTGTLRPCKEESKNWDTTKNLYIEGDNLEVLKLLQKGYYNKIKAVYIDPPYNTGNDFIYSDNYSDNLENYLDISGQSEEGIVLRTNTESDGRFHSNWLNMMYPRLKLARNLLSEDGVIFISIDDKELSQLKILCDEIFGYENYVSIIGLEITKTQGMKVKAAQEGSVVKNYEFVLCYSRKEGRKRIVKNVLYDKNDGYDNHFSQYINVETLERKTLINFFKEDSEINKEFENYNMDISMKNIEKLLSISEKFKSLLFKVHSKNIFQEMACNIIIPQDIEERLKHEDIVKYNDYLLTLSSGGKLRQYSSLFETLHYNDEYKSEFGRTTIRGNLWKNFYSDMMNVAKEGSIDFPNGKKPIRLIKQLSKWIGLSDNDIILDFFSGSATTAHAIFQKNLEETSNCRFILVQIPEINDNKSITYKEGYKNICEIGKERIRRAGDKIVQESGNKDLDIGFKVFKLDSSNLNKWDPDYDNLEQTLLVSQDNIKPDRTQEDLIYEIMLKYGIDLTLPIEEYDAGENKIYSIGFGALLICLDNKITKDIADSIIELASEDVCRVVFKDNGFASDADKTNIKETLRTHGIDEFITI